MYDTFRNYPMLSVVKLSLQLSLKLKTVYFSIQKSPITSSNQFKYWIDFVHKRNSIRNTYIIMLLLKYVSSGVLEGRQKGISLDYRIISFRHYSRIYQGGNTYVPILGSDFISYLRFPPSHPYLSNTFKYGDGWHLLTIFETIFPRKHVL